jgi:hypothetical protein
MWILFLQNYSTFTITIDLHCKYSHIHNFALILNKHILQSVNIPNSWLFLIIKICTLEYNVERTTNRIIVHFYNIFNTIDDSHNKLNMEINEKVCTYWFTKKFNKIIAKFHVLLKYPQTTNPNL